MSSNSQLIKRLQTAINQRFGAKLLVNRTQFYSEDQQRPITQYIIRKAVWDEDKGKNVNIEQFKSTSQIQIVLWLRDYWYELNGGEIPKDNEEWNKKKEAYYKKNGGDS